MKRRVLADVAALTVGTYLVQAMTFASNLAVRRQIGPLLAGTFALLVLIQSYTQFLNLGVLQASERELPFSRGAGDLERSRRLQVASLTVALGSGVLVALGMIGFALVRRARLDTPFFHGLLAYAAMAVITQWSQTYLMIHRTESRFQFLARTSVLFGMITAVANVLATRALGFDGLLASTLLVAVLGALVYTRYARPVGVSLAPAVKAESKALVRLGIPLLVLAFATIGLHTIDSLLAVKLLGTEALGLYTLAVSGASVIYGFGNSACAVYYPRMQEEFGRTRRPEAVLAFMTRPVLLMGSVLPLVVAPLFFFLPVIVAAYLPRFTAGVPAFRVVVAGVTLYALVQIPKTCLITFGKIAQSLLLTGATAVVAVVTALALRRLGLVGIALGACAGYLFGFVATTAFVYGARDSARPVAALIAQAVAPTLYSAALFAVIETFWRAGGGSLVAGAAGALAKTLAFVAAYTPLVVLLDSRTGLLRDHLKPLLRRLSGRARG